MKKAGRKVRLFLLRTHATGSPCPDAEVLTSYALVRSMLKLVAAFVSGAGLAVAGMAVLNPGQGHAREETKMAFLNRQEAIDRGDREMQTYFEEVIAWNAHMHLDPRFFDGPYEMDWLATEVDEPPYRRIKDGISYAELRRLMRGK